MANPVIAYLAEVLAGAGVGNSGSLTVSINITQGFEVRVPIRALQPSTVSAGPEVHAYRAIAGASGTIKYETESQIVGAFDRSASSDKSIVVILDTGMWILRLLAGGNGATYTASFVVSTQEVITAYA